MSTEHLKLVPQGPHAGAIDTLLGQVLDGRYAIESQLGEGGMGIVYKARHVTLGKPLAIKVLKAEVSKDQEIVQRFRQEAQSATAIGNHHIIDISDFGALADGSTYFVMEFLDGIALTKAIEPGKPLKSSRTIHIAKQLCRALGAAHDVGIVHRDLKPDNIYLISRGGDKDFVKVLDFGIAKVGGGKSKLTQVGQVFGTPHYMSPEQCAGTQVDKRTDIYALGVIMYEMTSSRVPFDADNLMGILTKHLYEEPVRPHELPPPVDVPAALEAVIMKCLAKKAETRYQTMQEVLSDLELVEQGLTPNAVTEGVRRASQTHGRSDTSGGRSSGLTVDVGSFELPKSKSTGLWVGGLLLLLLMGGGIFAAVSGSDSGEQTMAPEPTVAPVPPTTSAAAGETEAEKAPPEAEPATDENAQAEPEPEPQPEPEPPVRVELVSKPAGAEVYADGALLGRTPFEVERPASGEPGIDLSLKLGGYKDLSVRVTPWTQERLAVSLEKERRRVVSPPRPAAPRPAAKQPTPQPEAPRQEQEPKRPRPSTEVLDPWS